MAVQLEISDRVALITLNRPKRLNAWTPQLHQELWAMLDACEVIILSRSPRLPPDRTRMIDAWDTWRIVI